MQSSEGRASAAPDCCCHCLHCLPVALTYELCDATRRSQTHEPYQPFWPASIDTPTHYFHLKRRAMEWHCQEQARMGYSDHTVWRSSHSSVAAGASNRLLARRRRRQLSVRLPTARTNLEAGDELEFVGALPAEQAAALAPANQHLPAPASQQPEWRREEAMASACLKQASQQPVPPPTAAPQEQQMSLMASLDLCHRQQLAAAAAAAAAAAQSWAASRCPGLLPHAPHPSWPRHWEQPLAASWAPQQQHVGWGWGGGAAPVACPPPPPLCGVQELSFGALTLAAC